MATYHDADYSSPGGRDVARARDRYLRAVVRGSEAEAADVVRQAVGSGWGPATVYLDVLATALVEIGDLWHRGEITVAHEHQATQLTLRQMAVARSMFRPAQRTGLRALVSAAGTDGHMVGAQIFADLLAIAGWDVDFLGSGTPPVDLGKMVIERRPDLVAISAAMPAGKAAVEESIRVVKSAPGGPHVLFGGRLADQDPKWADNLGADAVVHDALDGLAAVRRMFRMDGDSVPLDILLHRMGERVRTHRAARGWSQQQLADAAGLDRTYLSALEHGKQNLTFGVIKKIADALEASVADLIPV